MGRTGLTATLPIRDVASLLLRDAGVGYRRDPATDHVGRLRAVLK